MLTKLNREISPPKPEASQPQTIAPGGTEKGQNDGGEKEDAQDLVGEADQNETAHNHNGVDETVKGSGATGLHHFSPKSSFRSQPSCCFHHVMSASRVHLQKRDNCRGAPPATAVLRSRVCASRGWLLDVGLRIGLRAIHSTLQAEQELLVLGIDPNLGNADHAHNVASLRHEDKEGHVTIQSANSIVYPQDHFFDSEDEDFAGQRATAKHRLSPKRRPH